MKIDGKSVGLLYELRDRLADRIAGIEPEHKSLPRFMPNGEEVSSLSQLAAVLNVDEFVAHLYAKKLPKTQKCSEKDCDEQATKRVLWAEGRAYQPACDKHVESTKKRIIAKNGSGFGEIDGVRDIKAIRRVRTVEGARQYGQPIGSIIKPGTRTFAGYERVRDTPLEFSRAHIKDDDALPQSPDTNGLPVPPKKRVLRKKPGAKPTARTKQGRPAPKAQVEAEAKFRKTYADLIKTAKAHAADNYSNQHAGRLQKLQDDMDALRALHKQKKWPLPDVHKKKPSAKKQGPFVVTVLTAAQKAEYDNLPNDEARAMYRKVRLEEASGHSNALSKALEFAPRFAENLKLGRKIKGGYKVRPTAEGDEYVLKQDAAGAWHAEYDAGDGTMVEVDPARYKTAAYALAALERWHEEYYARQNAGQTTPELPEGSSMSIGMWHPEKGIDYYPVWRRSREYWLAYDGTGWYAVKYEKDGSETQVFEVYYADAAGALRALEQADIEAHRRKPVNTGKPGDRVISQDTIKNYDKTAWEDVKKGDRIAVNMDTGLPVENQAEFLQSGVEYRVVGRVRNDTIYFTDKTKAPLPWHVYVRKQSKTVATMWDDLARIAQEQGWDEVKDVGTGSVPSLTRVGYSLPGALGGKPRRLVRGRKPSVSERCRILLRRQAQKDVQAFYDLMQTKGLRRVSSPEGVRRFKQPMGSVIRTDDFGRVSLTAAPDEPHMFAARKPTSALGKPHYEDDWIVYDVDILGTQYGITDDGNGWYSYFKENDKYAQADYWPSPEKALEALVVWHATQPKKKEPARKSRVGKKDYPYGTRLKNPPPKATRPIPDKNKVFRKATADDLARLKKEWGISVPPGYVDVEINVDTNDDSMVARGKSPTSSTPDKWQPLYTPHHIERQHVAKQAKAAKGMGERPKLEKAVNRDAATDDNAGMLALVLYMGLRPDSSGGKGPEGLTGKVYGASTLERRHVVVKGTKMSLVFAPAKGKGKTIELPVTNPTVIKALTARLDRPDNEQLFTATDTSANAYLKKTMGDYTMRNLRTMVANESALEYLSTRTPPFERPKNKAQLNAIKNEVGDHVAGILGNTRSMALNSYIDRNLWDDYSEGIA